MNPRSEPLLWVQLLGLAAAPAELLLLLLVLAGSDPGPLPGLERLLCWGLGALLPAALLWRQPADVWSLLLLQTPAKGRSEQQRRLSRLQSPLPLKLLAATGALALLPVLWLSDSQAAVATALSPLRQSSRLVALLLAAALLGLMLWQWQQLLQALWLLSRPASQLATTSPLEPTEQQQQRLGLGLPLLLPEPLQLAVAGAAVTPEQQTEDQQRTDLNEQIP